MGDAPVRRHAAAQPNLCALAATPHTARLPPLAAAEAHSYPHNRGLPGVEPEQPNPPKETASSAGPPTSPRRRRYRRNKCDSRRTVDSHIGVADKLRSVPPGLRIHYLLAKSC